MTNRLLVFLAISLSGLFLAVNYSFSAGPGNLTAGSSPAGPNKHNLSVSGPGPFKATAETQICVFCHTPHTLSSNPPLWNHRLSTTASYTLPSSATQKSVPSNPPDGASKLCLSCHDGTVPLGAVMNYGGHSATIAMGGGAFTGTSNMGTDISGHHLVSIELPASLNAAKQNDCQTLTIQWNVKDPANISAAWAPLQPTDNSFQGSTTRMGVQCTSCHDPHLDFPLNSAFLKAGTRGSWSTATRSYSDALCTTCHCQCQLGVNCS